MAIPPHEIVIGKKKLTRALSQINSASGMTWGEICDPFATNKLRIQRGVTDTFQITGTSKIYV